MSEKKQRSGGLGRGLDAIFADNSFDEAEEKNTQPIMLKLSDIEPRSDQPRKSFDAEALAALADSIAANGLIQPIAVRVSDNGFYQIVAGERRWRASKMAGLTEVPVVIMQLDDRKTAELSLIENLQREDLNPIEEAAAYKSLLEDYGLTQEALSKSVGRSRPAIANSMRLLELPDEVSAFVISGELSAGHARALLGLTDRGNIPSLAKLVMDRGLSVRQTEKLVKAENEAAANPDEEADKAPDNAVVVDYNAEVERMLTESLGRRVRLNNSNPKKPKTITIEYTDNEDLDSLIALLTSGK